MSIDTERGRIADLTDATIDCACDSIGRFTVGLNRVSREENREVHRLIGTGALIVVEGAGDRCDRPGDRARL
jgi:hypothetical protein